MFAHPRRIARIWLALVMLSALTGCARVTPTAQAPTAQPTPAPAIATEIATPTTSRPTASPLPLTSPVVASPVRVHASSDRAELDANLSLHRWIEVLETGNSDLGRYIYRLEAGATRDEVPAHIEALRRFIAQAKDPANSSFGTYQGFHTITGNYLVAATGHRVGIALMRFEHATICFQADLVEVQQLWSIERWEPITPDVCQAERTRLPEWVRAEWGALFPQ